MTHVVALDIGSSSVRSAVFDETATALEGTRARRRHRVQPGGVLDPPRLLEHSRAVLESACSRAEADAPIGASCFWHSLLALDADARPLAPLLTWRDVRSAPQADQLARTIDPDAVHARTGCPVHASFWPAKLAWLAAEQPYVFRAAHRFVGFADWLLLQETGELRTSVSMASATGLWTDDGWDTELLEALGVDPERLPRVSDEPVGRWQPALGDGACSNLGSGCTTPDLAALNVGTSAAVRVLTREAGPPPPGLFRYRVDGARTLVGGSLSVGGNLHAWLHSTLRLPESRGLAERPPAGHGLAFVPLLAGERSPGWDARRRGLVHGLRFETSAVDLLQAGLEGVAYELRRVVELLPPGERVVVSGGALAGTEGWVQIVADVLERPLLISAEPEASIRGAAVFLLERQGIEAPAPAIERTVEPRGERAPAYRDAYARHRRLLDLA
jgi:gluconokinase